MPTFAEDIENGAEGADGILSVVIGDNEDFMYRYDGSEPLPSRWIDPEFLNRPLTWAEARPLLDYQYYDGYGSQDCHHVYVYTATHVYGVHEYDGATWLTAIPRDPTAGKVFGL